MHNYIGFIPPLRWQDALDILIVAYVIYRIALLIRGTRTMQMVVGLGHHRRGVRRLSDAGAVHAQLDAQ